MEILISVGLLAVGLIIGFFVARYVYTERNANAAAKSAEQSVKAVMTQQAEHHVFQTRQTLQGLQHQIDVLNEQLSEYETQVQPSDENDNAPKMTFFGEQATAMLRNSSKVRANQPSSKSDEQPRDFANSASGLFVDDKRQSNDQNL